MSHSRLAMYWRRFINWSFDGLRDILNWDKWLSATLKYFGEENLLCLLQRYSKNCSPPPDVLHTQRIV